MEKYNVIIVSTICFILGFILFYQCSSPINYMPTTIEIEKIIRDTIPRIIKAEPIIINKIKTKIITQYDTIIQYKPFISQIDTVIKFDTIFAQFKFPDNEFSMSIKSKVDTFKLPQTTIYKSMPNKSSWWETPTMIMGGILFGYIIKSADK